MVWSNVREQQARKLLGIHEESAELMSSTLQNLTVNHIRCGCCALAPPCCCACPRLWQCQDGDCVWGAHARHGHIQLAVGEAGPWQKDSHPLKGLPLGFVDGHSKCSADGELAAAQGEGKAAVRGLDAEAANPRGDPLQRAGRVQTAWD